MTENPERRQVDQWTGTGALTHKGNTLGVVRYRIVLQQAFEGTWGLFGFGRRREVAGRTEFTFWIDHGPIDLWRWMGTTLTLHLEDGRRIDVVHDGARFVAARETLGRGECGERGAG